MLRLATVFLVRYVLFPSNGVAVRIGLLDSNVSHERIRRGAFTSVPDLESAIMDYLEHHNADPRPFVWTASASAILEKVARAKQALESQH